MTTITTTISQPPTTFQPIHYIPTSHKPIILPQRIHTILLIAHAQFTPPPTLSTTTPSPPTNHWSIYLLPPPTSSSPPSSAPQPSIHIDCQPSHTTPSTVLPRGSKANLIVSLLNTSTDTSTDTHGLPTGTGTELAIPDAVYRVPLPVTRLALTVADIMDLLLAEGKEKYEFDEHGVGCRYWVLGVVELLVQRGIVSEGDRERAREAVGRLWPGGGESVMDRGAYY